MHHFFGYIHRPDSDPHPSRPCCVQAGVTRRDKQMQDRSLREREFPWALPSARDLCYVCADSSQITAACCAGGNTSDFADFGDRERPIEWEIHREPDSSHLAPHLHGKAQAIGLPSLGGRKISSPEHTTNLFVPGPRRQGQISLPLTMIEGQRDVTVVGDVPSDSGIGYCCIGVW